MGRDRPCLGSTDMKGSVGHFELPADDVKRATAFYQKVFDWMPNPVPNMEYTMLATTPSNERGMPNEPGAINGGMTQRGGAVRSPVITIIVEDIDAAAKLIQQHGGKVTVPKKDIGGGMGHTAYFTDTEGNTVGLYQAPPR
jgi:predicted enzyme related to lactoylglutathione lyase